MPSGRVDRKEGDYNYRSEKPEIQLHEKQVRYGHPPLGKVVQYIANTQVRIEAEVGWMAGNIRGRMRSAPRLELAMHP